ncbi:MAG TPA: TylF/MycF/NovP-related O-methyltransferase [Stellaceae bacterium]|nr:TylF/MycF/NovP-related O-methyltransferase [Stellaceae bacterium]
MSVPRDPPDLDPGFWPLYEACREQTMTSVERMYALYKAVEYIARHAIDGDLVECGVWRGGSVMMMALALRAFGASARVLHCFDTFEGMPPPGAPDIRHDDGASAAAILATSPKDEDSVYWGLSPLETVRSNLAATGYPPQRIKYVKGKVEDTLPAHLPERIALLRLDTDWYASTRHELIHLYPRLAEGGVIIIDDYGFWRGARQAVDEYLAESGARLLLNRIDVTGRIGVKLGSR